MVIDGVLQLNVYWVGGGGESHALMRLLFACQHLWQKENRRSDGIKVWHVTHVLVHGLGVPPVQRAVAAMLQTTRCIGSRGDALH
jgi:hypothetical protein